MMYKTKVAVCSEIPTKHSTQSEHHVEILNVNTLRTGDADLRFYITTVQEDDANLRF